MRYPLVCNHMHPKLPSTELNDYQDVIVSLLEQGVSQAINNLNNGQSSTTSSTVLGDVEITSSAPIFGAFGNFFNNIFNAGNSNSSQGNQEDKPQTSFFENINNAFQTVFNQNGAGSAPPSTQSESNSPSIINQIQSGIQQIGGGLQIPPAGQIGNNTIPGQQIFQNVGSINQIQSVGQQINPPLSVPANLGAGLPQIGSTSGGSTSSPPSGGPLDTIQQIGQNFQNVGNINQLQNVGQQINAPVNLPGNLGNNNTIPGQEIFQNVGSISQIQTVGQQINPPLSVPTNLGGGLSQIGSTSGGSTSSPSSGSPGLLDTVQQIGQNFQNVGSNNPIQNVGQQINVPGNLGIGLPQIGNTSDSSTANPSSGSSGLLDTVQQVGQNFQNLGSINQLQNVGQQINSSVNLPGNIGNGLPQIGSPSNPSSGSSGLLDTVQQVGQNFQNIGSINPVQNIGQQINAPVSLPGNLGSGVPQIGSTSGGSTSSPPSGSQGLLDTIQQIGQNFQNIGSINQVQGVAQQINAPLSLPGNTGSRLPQNVNESEGNSARKPFNLIIRVPKSGPSDRGLSKYIDRYLP